MGNEQIDIYQVDEIARRRDEVVRRMANTPPQPRVAPKSSHESHLRSVRPE